MRLAAIQHDIVWEDAAATREHVAPLIDRAVSLGATFVSLTEMFSTGFSMNTDVVAEPKGTNIVAAYNLGLNKPTVGLFAKYLTRKQG